jgi:hypothetical protein
MTDGAPTALVQSAPVDAPTNARPPLARGDDKGGSPPGKQRTVTAKADTTGARTWPGGALALGAVSREPERQSWWQMPPPGWSPFLVGQERP